MNETEQAHNSLRNILLNGRILINGLPPTATEISNILRGEQMLYEKATNFDRAQAMAAQKKKTEKPQGPKDHSAKDGKKE
jgi:hypothetical protein